MGCQYRERHKCLGVKLRVGQGA